MANSGSTLLSSTNKWHSTATHTSSSISATHGYCHRPSIPLSDISTNINSAAAMTTVSRKCIYVKEVISVNNSAAHLPFSSDSGSASECESGELSSDEYPSQIKIKPHGQENLLDSTHEMGTLAQFLNHSFPIHKDVSITSHKSDRHASDIHRHEVPDHGIRSSSSTPRMENLPKTRRLSEHLSTTIQRQKSRSEQRHNAYTQLKHLAQRRLNIVAELVTLDEQYEATLAKLLLPGSH